MPNKESVPQQMRAVYEEVVNLTDSVCQAHLNSEYAELARKMAAALARKRPSPLATSKPSTWACSIVYALGRVNFLFDKSQEPYMRADALCKLFGVSQSTVSSKAKIIEQALHVGVFDPKWSLRSMADANPLAWLISVNGIIVDARTMPLVVQEEAFRRGMIPYIPALEPSQEEQIL